jgi:2-methylcitrate dehydratase PrpD
MADNSSASAQLISHVGRFGDAASDPAVRRRTELCFLDSLSCFSAGRSLKHFAPNRAVAIRLFGMDSDGARRSPFLSAYLYGQAANALDYDDTLIGHPGTPIVASVLAVASRERLSTDRLLRGIAAGYEAHAILARAAIASPERAAQVRSVGVWDTVAAAVGLGVALGLDDSMMKRVIGVAVPHSLLPYTGKWYERPVPALKNNLGWAAAGAVLSVDLAIEGHTGVTNPLDGDSGMWRMAGSDRWAFDQALHDQPAVLRVGFKPFPVCWHLQEYLKGFARLLDALAPDDDIVEIAVTGPHWVEKFCQGELLGPADSAFSMPAAFSLMLSQVEPGPQWYSVDGGSHVVRHTQMFSYACSEKRAICLRTRRGAELNAMVDVCDYLNPAAWGLDEDGVLAKHRRLTDPELRAAAAAALGADRDGIPERLYTTLDSVMANPDRQSASA